MSFADDINKFAIKVQTNSQAVFVNTASHVYESIVNGDSLTGAPGQPVDTGALRASWQLTFDGPSTATVSTNIEYAPYVEDNVRGVTFKNHGPHSVALTVAGISRIIAAETAKVVGK
jgi:hypothetical protein